MHTNDKAGPAISQDGAVEIDEAQLQQVSGGPSDYLLVIDGVKGESESRKRPVGGVTAAFGDGSVRPVG